MSESKTHFDVDVNRLTEVCSSVSSTANDGKGIFYGGPDKWRKRYLPQWNLPKELEHEPERDETAKPLEASNFLFCAVQFERQNVSRYLMKQIHRIWNNPKERWFFDPFEVAERPLSETERIVVGELRYNIAGTNEKKTYLRFYENSQLLISKYGGDPRNLVDKLSIDDARKRLMKFQGIGTGIANLYIIYLLDRRIASPSDPENILFKIDVHKGRIPINAGCIVLNNGRKDIHVNSLVSKFEQAYKTVCQKEGFNPSEMDAALWVLGSEICAKRSYRACWMNCPLMHNGLCLSNVPLQQNEGAGAGRYVLYDERGKRTETRRVEDQSNQKHFFL